MNSGKFISPEFRAKRNPNKVAATPVNIGLEMPHRRQTYFYAEKAKSHAALCQTREMPDSPSTKQTPGRHFEHPAVNLPRLEIQRAFSLL